MDSYDVVHWGLKSCLFDNRLEFDSNNWTWFCQPAERCFWCIRNQFIRHWQHCWFLLSVTFELYKLFCPPQWVESYTLIITVVVSCQILYSQHNLLIESIHTLWINIAQGYIRKAEILRVTLALLLFRFYYQETMSLHKTVSKPWQVLKTITKHAHLSNTGC